MPSGNWTISLHPTIVPSILATKGIPQLALKPALAAG
jgi:hypothetical protein